MDERLMGSDYGLYQHALRYWESYKSSHKEQDRREALLSKKLVLERFGKSCERALLDKGGGGERSNACRLNQQLKDQLDEIKGDAMMPADSAPSRTASLLPPGTTFTVIAVDPIDLEGIDAGRRFRAQLQYPVQSNGKVILPEGTDVFLKATRRQLPGASNPNIAQIAITVDYVSMDNKHIPIATNEFFRSLRINAADTFLGRSHPNPLQDRQVMPQTHLSFLALSEATN